MISRAAATGYVFWAAGLSSSVGPTSRGFQLVIREFYDSLHSLTVAQP